ncbi:sulfatase-like hydrolase/transferase [Pigmentiphaga kullae]|uniref:Heptose-I-phosphate ethanolaminephosphotransferase n=1 Tax=Pigmentiphaga kullae TaxID=151784 RepID=A0A4Q7NND2_9BURK|nr:phosphoethanolamine transferase [Pigmentiphaga kullae]RZS86582.1 heptose-I-phosphate ethanolaminephosphotransferase [Pigmentiphaga kullae]
MISPAFTRQKLATHSVAAWLPSLLLGALSLLFIVQGYDGKRVGQVMVLLLPFVVWLAWPVRSAWLHWLRAGIVWLATVGFMLDAVARSYLTATYQAAPDSSLVLGAIANTNVREGGEYLSSYWPTLLPAALVVLVAALVVAGLVALGRRSAGRSRWARVVLVSLLLVGTAAHASKPWRRLQPVAFWVNWNLSVQQLRADWADMQDDRDAALARAKAVQPVVSRPGPATVVLVISDSVNRDNLSLYGYARATTPRLMVQQRELGDSMVVMRHAWSVDASTLPSLTNMFSFGRAAGDESQHLLALARQAGYKTWWISNHDDVAIEHQHGRLADVVDFVNREPGRITRSLDEEILDCVQEALDDPADTKFIVVHLLGAHPHYEKRFPLGDNPFDDEVDAVEAGMMQQKRASWVRRSRHAYDAALLYHDTIVSRLLDQTRAAGEDRSNEYLAWMYLSDHGQEVGHGGNLVGHSPGTPAGYRIPAIVWRNALASAPATETALRPFRADWTGWTVADLLHLSWAGKEYSRSVLSTTYKWVEPVIPVEGVSFNE